MKFAILYPQNPWHEITSVTVWKVHWYIKFHPFIIYKNLSAKLL